MAKGNWSPTKIPGGGGEVILDKDGMRELLKSAGIEAELRQRMSRVEGALPGSEMRISTSPTRVRVSVARGSDFEEANTGELSRALNLAGGRRGTLNVRAKPKPRNN